MSLYNEPLVEIIESRITSTARDQLVAALDGVREKASAVFRDALAEVPGVGKNEDVERVIAVAIASADKTIRDAAMAGIKHHLRDKVTGRLVGGVVDIVDGV